MIVLEIGSGESAGPFFEGADTHFIIDKDREALATAAEHYTELTPIFGADATRLELPDLV